MEAKATWKGKLSFTGTGDSGHEILLGASSSIGGDDDGLRPMELFALGLAGCTGMDVISILQKKRQEVGAFEVEVHMKRADEHPKVFTQAEIEYFVTGKSVQEKALVRAIELSAARYCPAQAMLGKIMPIAIKYHIYEDTGDEKPEIVVSGTLDMAL
ncbi:MAG: OsmC family protein [Anaerolineales bacterium]|nr:OsmC family protein [Anaerolineales bacterium]